ncbi:MAG TPA: Ig-like domain-containing protein [Frankiaceae bacterium]|jgi:hypothetical protein|nr:Ig-like domain-containing protein [Frankiaceae bacterium]
MLTTLAVPLAASPASAVAPTGLTTLVAPPAGETVGGNPTFTWTPVPGAAKYRVQVSRSEIFDSTVYSADTYNVHATPTTALPVGQLYWRVAPTDGSSGVGTYVSSTFTRVWAEAPSLTAPADTATLTYPDDPLLFTWDALPGAKTYNIQIDDDPEFINPIVSTGTNNTSYTVADPQTSGQTFYWHVQGVADGVVSPWSDARTYSVQWPAKPVLISPSNTTVTDVVFQWSPVAGAASYDIMVSPNPDFANNVTINARVTSTRYSPPTTILNGSYFWRVRANDTKTTPNLGDWSSEIEVAPGEFLPAQFTRAWNERPTLLGPANGDLGVTVPTLSWTPVPYASHYEIWLGDDENFTPGHYVNCYTNQTTFTPYSHVAVTGQTNPAVPGTCQILENTIGVGEMTYWKVRGIDAPANVLGLFSDPASFQLVHPQTVSLVSPADLSTTDRPVLTWQPVTGVSRYRVTVVNTSNGSNVTGSPFTTYATTLTPNALTSGSSYTWYVQTLDDAGRAGLAPHPSTHRRFTYQAATAALTAPQLVSPVLGAADVLMPSMQWEPVIGAKSYKVFVGTAGANSVSLEGTTTSTAFTDMDVTKNVGTYEWFVDAYNENGVWLSSSTVETFAVTAIGLATPTSPTKCVLDTCTASSETPKLTWDPVPNVGGYLVYLANDASFTNMIRTYRTQYPTLTFRESYPDSVAGQAYYWFVRPCRSASLNAGCGPFDNTTFPGAGAFRKRSLGVTLISPANGSTVPASGTQPQDITFSWEEFAQTNAANVPPSGQGARRYRVEVWDVADLAQAKIDDVYVDQTTYTPADQTYPEGTLYWRVSAIDGSNQQLTYSEVWHVTKSTPPLAVLSPEPGSTQAGTPYFRWTPQPGSSRYDLEVYKNGDMAFSAANRVTLTGSSPRLTAYTPTTSLPQGVYAWRVRRVDNGNRPGPWTLGSTFTLAQSAPSLVSPADETVISSMDVVFTWTGVPKAAQYRFEASTTSSFTTLVEAANTVMTSWAPVAKYPDGALYWRVKVLDAAGNALATSAWRTFRKDSVAPTVTAKAPTSNAPITGGLFTASFSEPVKGLSTSTFTMKVFGTTTPVPGTVTPGAATMASSATFKPSVTLVPGETYTLSLSNGVVDANGNPLTPYSWNVRTALAVDGNAAAVQYYWDRDTYTYASGGGYLASRTAGARLTWTFTGTSYSIVGRRAPDGGYADVYVDGVKHGTASFHSASHLWKQTVFSKSGLSNATHRLELRVMGTKPSASTSTWVYPDAFRYGASQVEETHPSVVQAFRTVGHTGAYGRSYELNVHTASGDSGSQPYVLLRFRGTGIQWKGFRSTAGGIAGVYIDGAGRGNVDTYGNVASTAGTTLWSVSGLSNAQHTIKIVLTGGKRAASTGYNVTVDSFTVI